MFRMASKIQIKVVFRQMGGYKKDGGHCGGGFHRLNGFDRQGADDVLLNGSSFLCIFVIRKLA